MRNLRSTRRPDLRRTPRRPGWAAKARALADRTHRPRPIVRSPCAVFRKNGGNSVAHPLTFSLARIDVSDMCDSELRGECNGIRLLEETTGSAGTDELTRFLKAA